MLGNEEVRIRARLLKVGDYLERHYDRWEGTYYGGFIIHICPSDDPWLPADALTIHLDIEKTASVLPNDLASIIGEVREINLRA
ncbi:hypothetical protein [Nonomuraea angiospora]|uniref:hypothetical protein n=1 Tax=Nonomuraea angiospora TaxID=46172 RepID=UPI0029B06781|nr:hypothetical protein [Nonomuraea angiospora]MDX3100505.1 hypothetical protein [Nonomuraea angiospora]